MSCHDRQAIPYTMPCAPGHTIHNPLTARPYHTYYAKPMPCLPGHNHIHVLCDARQAISYTMWCPPGHTIICDARKAIPYHMPGPPGHTIIPCDARQAILYSMRGRQAIPYTMWCYASSGHTIYYAMPDRPFLFHAMSAMPYHIPCHAHQAIPHTMPCPLGHTIYHASQDIQYTMPSLDRP